MNEQEKLNRVPASEFDPAADWRTLPLAVIDFETSGLDPVKDRIVEYGIAFFDIDYRKGMPIKSVGALVNPEIKLSDEVIKIHGITNEQLEQCKTFEQQYSFIENHLRNRVPVAYNANFDREFLLNESGRVIQWLIVERAHLLGHAIVTAEFIANVLETYNLPAAFRSDVEWIDPLVWVRYLYKYEKSKKLTDVCKKLNIELSGAHRATADSEATGKLLFALASLLPRTYGELIEQQKKLAVTQERDYQKWKAKQKS